MNKTQTATLAQLTKAAQAMGYTVEDDRENATLHVHAPEGKGWENGQLTSLSECYGSCGSYTAAWRKQAISDMMEKLQWYPASDLVDAAE